MVGGKLSIRVTLYSDLKEVVACGDDGRRGSVVRRQIVKPNEVLRLART
jgi:hypothetical protein